MIDIVETAWFAGLTDGEGCFMIIHQRDSGGYVPQYQISLRDDDRAVIEAVSAAFGGSLAIRPRRGSANPAAQLTISAKEGLAKLASYFDRFPLQSKKARDYALWREAVRLYLTEGRYSDELPVLREDIRGGRIYKETSSL